jgi:hypothetical protein
VDDLERRYRRLLRTYPSGYRREREDEIIGTFLDGAAPGQTRPTAADTADIVVAGLRARLGVLGGGDVGLGLRTAAPVALAVAAGMAVLGLLRDSHSTAGHPSPFRPALFVYAAWLLAVIGGVVLPVVLARVLAAMALLGTLAALVLVSRSWSSPSPGWSLMVLTLLGCVAVAGGGPMSTRQRAGLAAGTMVSVAVLGGSALLVPTADGPSWLTSGRVMNHHYQSAVEAVVAVAIAVLLAGMAVLGRLRDRRWRVAALTLLVATGWLLVPNLSGGDTRFVFGAVIVLSIGCATWYLRRTPVAAEQTRPFGLPATLAVGCAAGLAASTLLAHPDPVFACFSHPADPARDCQELQRWISHGRPAYAAWLVALAGWAVLPRLAARVLVAVAVLATPAVLWPDQWHHPAPDNVVPMTLSALGIVALLGSAGPTRPAERAGVLAAAAATLALPTIVTLALQPAYAFTTIGPMFTLAFIPLAVALATGWRAASHPSGSSRVLAAATVAVSAAWLVVLAFDLTWYPIVAILLAIAGLLSAVLFRTDRPRRPSTADGHRWENSSPVRR